MYLSCHKTRVLSKLFVMLGEPHGEAEIRMRVGDLVLDLLDADYYASYVWNHTGGMFDRRISINMSDDNLDTYERYYQHHDPITPTLQRRRRPTLVNQVMAQPALMKTEFFNDFLFHDGLYWGVNLYAWSGSENIGDMRVWRAKRRPNFDADTIELLGLIQPAFEAALRRARSVQALPSGRWIVGRSPCTGDSALAALSSREQDIAQLIALGYPDKAIASQLGIGFTTVRTHLGHMFDKLGVDSRVKLVCLLTSGRPLDGTAADKYS